jgi:hypothetical protein
MAALAIISTLAGAVTLWIQDSAFALGALLSVMLIALALVTRGLAASEPHVTPSEYFGASSVLGSITTLRSLGSSWVMLGNVVVAGMILGQVFGLITFWMVITWSLAFVLMSQRVDRVRSVLSPDDTLHSFLHRAYGSLPMRRVAALITITVGLGVFVIELIAGIALLVAALPAQMGEVFAPILVLMLVLAMCIAAISGGLRAVITTDAMLWPIVIAGIAVLLIFSVELFSDQSSHIVSQKLFPDTLHAGGILAFFVGVAALQIPLLLGDYGTWQRIKATHRRETESLVTHTLRQAVWQFFLWGVPVLAGIAVLGLPALFAAQSGNLYPSSYPLIEVVHHWISATEIPLALRAALTTIFITGMLAVLVSTANTYLLIAMETWVRDFRPRSICDVFPNEQAIGMKAVRDARSLCIIFALAASLPIAALVQFQINLVGLIVIVFSVQVALAPAAVLALYHSDNAKELAPSVVRATLAGFIFAILYGVFTSFAVTGWWKDYGTFLTAAVALAVPTLSIAAVLRRRRGWREATSFLSELLWPFARRPFDEVAKTSGGNR